MKRGALVEVTYADLAAHPIGDTGSDSHLVIARCLGYWYGYRMMDVGAKKIRTLVLACTKDDEDNALGGWNTIPANLVLDVKEICHADLSEKSTVRRDEIHRPVPGRTVRNRDGGGDRDAGHQHPDREERHRIHRPLGPGRAGPLQ